MRLPRLISILLLLMQHDKISTSRLAEHFEVTQRTIFRDLEALNAAGVPIIGYPGVKGGIAISDHFRLENGVFTLADMMAVLEKCGCTSVDSGQVLDLLAEIKGMPTFERMVII